MIPGRFGLAIGNSGVVGHAVGHNCTLGRTPFRVSAADDGRPRPRTRLAGKRSRRVRRRTEVEAGPGLGCPIPAQHQDLGQQTSAPGALPRCMELKSVDVPRRQLRCQANALARGARDGTIRRRRDAWEPSAVVARAHARSGPCGKAQTNCAQCRLCPRSGCVRLARSSSVASVEAANHGSVRLLGWRSMPRVRCRRSPRS